MLESTLDAVAQAAKGRRVGREASIRGVTTDSRRPRPQSLFVSLVGERFDGHQYVDAAIAGGSAAALIDEAHAEQFEGVAYPLVVVPDTLRALGDLAQWWRRQYSGPVLGITGSNGKTSTKELAAHMLALLGPVHRTAGNLNNLIGVPLTLLEAPLDAAVWVIEMGMNAPGEIARQSEIAEPTIGLVTCIGAAHIGSPGLGSIQAIADAKGELFRGLAPEGVMIVNADDERVVAQAEAARRDAQRLIRVGRHEENDVVIRSAAQNPTGLELRVDVAGEETLLRWPWFGLHQAGNAALAFATALDLGCDAHALAEHMGKLEPVPARFEPLPLEGIPGGFVYNDAYNANEASTIAAIDTIAALAEDRPLLAVIGDMLELGEFSQAAHRQVGEHAAVRGVRYLFAYGDYAADVEAGFNQAGGQDAKAYPCEAYAEMEADVRQRLESGALVLVKASRGRRLDRMVRALTSSEGASS